MTPSFEYSIVLFVMFLFACFLVIVYAITRKDIIALHNDVGQSLDQKFTALLATGVIILSFIALNIIASCETQGFFFSGCTLGIVIGIFLIVIFSLIVSDKQLKIDDKTATDEQKAAVKKIKMLSWIGVASGTLFVILSSVVLFQIYRMPNSRSKTEYNITTKLESARRSYESAIDKRILSQQQQLSGKGCSEFDNDQDKCNSLANICNYSQNKCLDKSENEIKDKKSITMKNFNDQNS